MLKVVKVGAEWCPQCKALEQSLKRANIEFESSDVEADGNIYNVRTLPVTILFDDDKEVERLVGLFDVNKLKNEISKYNDRV